MAFDTDPRAVWARFAVARQALDRVTASFGRRGIDVLAVKGIVTSEWLYDDSCERPLGDVDVRIRRRDFGAAVRVAASEGWHVDRCVWTYRNLMVEVDGVSVDVESHLGPPFVSALSVDRMLGRATRAASGFWVPEIHDHAVLLTINVFKDKITRAFSWALEDVDRVVRASGFDEAVFVGRVREAGVSGPAWVVADWMAARRSNEVWRSIRQLLGGDAPRRTTYTSMMARIFAEANPMSLRVRLLARTASDNPARWPLAVALAAAWEVESRWDAGRRSRRH